MTLTFNLLLGSVASGMTWGVIFFAVPAGLATYGWLVVGRQIGRKKGMIAAALGCLGFWSLPAVWLIQAYARLMISGQPIYGDSLLGLWMLGTCVAALLGVSLALLMGWARQSAEAELSGA
jgi:hypothetical protein